jgi:hypothetical protein
MSKQLQAALDRAAKACEPVLHELLDEINKLGATRQHHHT